MGIRLGFSHWVRAHSNSLDVSQDLFGVKSVQIKAVLSQWAQELVGESVPE